MSVISILRNPDLNQRECDIGLGKHGLQREGIRVEGRAQDDGCTPGLENNQPKQELIDYLTMWENVLKMIFRF